MVIMESPGFIPFQSIEPPQDPVAAAAAFHEFMGQRRSVRDFSDKPVPTELIEHVISAAGTAPSGANKQPWRFVAVQDPGIKKEIREAAEAEEHEFYTHRAPQSWIDDLHPFGTDKHKPFLEIAPWLIVVFKCMKDDSPQSESEGVYYVNESVGIAVGLLLAAIHHAGLVALTHTPSPMKFLTAILQRPAHERPFLLIPVGWPAEGCQVPDLERKALEDIMIIDRPGTAS